MQAIFIHIRVWIRDPQLDVSDNFRIFKGYKKVNTCNDGQCRVNCCIIYYRYIVAGTINNMYAFIITTVCNSIRQAEWASFYPSPNEVGAGVMALDVRPSVLHTDIA